MDEPSVDFFISYTRPDRAWAIWIERQLRDAGFSAILDVLDFRPGSNFMLEMDSATQKAERTVAILSSNYPDSLYAKPEWAAALVEDPTGAKRKLVPVRVEEAEMKGLLKAIIYIDLVGLDEAAARATLLAGVQGGRVDPKSATFPGASASPATSASPQPRYPGALPPIWNVRLRNPNFTGRDDELETLSTSLQSGQVAAVTQAIHGLGGMGKTQLAVEYAYRYHDLYDLVWWVDAEEASTLLRIYAFLLTKLELPDQAADEQMKANAVRRWLEQHGKWLLIFDNARAPEQLRSLLPRASTGHVVITSRNRNWSEIASAVPLDVWPKEDAVAYVLERTQEENRDDAEELADEMGCLPLALAQATGYIISVPTSIRAYLGLFRGRRKDLWKDEEPPPDYEATVATTWEVTLDKLPKPSADLLQLFAFLAPDDIPWELLERGTSILPDDLAAVIADPIERNRAIRPLSEFSLVEATHTGVSLHRMLQAVVRLRLPIESRNRLAGQAVELVNHVFPFDEHEPETWVLLRHAYAAVEHGKSVAPEASRRVLNQTVKLLTDWISRLE